MVHGGAFVRLGDSEVNKHDFGTFYSRAVPAAQQDVVGLNIVVHIAQIVQFL